MPNNHPSHPLLACPIGATHHSPNHSVRNPNRIGIRDGPDRSRVTVTWWESTVHQRPKTNRRTNQRIRTSDAQKDGSEGRLRGGQGRATTVVGEVRRGRRWLGHANSHRKNPNEHVQTSVSKRAQRQLRPALRKKTGAKEARKDTRTSKGWRPLSERCGVAAGGWAVQIS